MHRTLLSLFIAGMISVPLVAHGQPQSGSTGGTIGKQGKSASGDEGIPTPGRTLAPHKPIRTQTTAPVARYLGCFRDQQSNWLAGANTQGRDLDGFMGNEPGMTSARCIAVCRSQRYAYAGTQYATYCFCGNKYGRSGGASNCNTPCGGNPTEMCGGGWANSVYSVSGAQTVR